MKSGNHRFNHLAIDSTAPGRGGITRRRATTSQLPLPSRGKTCVPRVHFRATPEPVYILPDHPCGHSQTTQQQMPLLDELHIGTTYTRTTGTATDALSKVEAKGLTPPAWTSRFAATCAGTKDTSGHIGECCPWRRRLEWPNCRRRARRRAGAPTHLTSRHPSPSEKPLCQGTPHEAAADMLFAPLCRRLR